MEWNVKRFNEKCKRNYITIITVEYQCEAEMEDNIRQSTLPSRLSTARQKLPLNRFIRESKKKKEKPERKREEERERQRGGVKNDAILMTKYYSIRRRVTIRGDRDVNIISR